MQVSFSLSPVSWATLAGKNVNAYPGFWDRSAGDPTSQPMCSDLWAVSRPQQLTWHELPVSVCLQHRAVTIWYWLHKATRAQRCLGHFSHTDHSYSSVNCGIWTQPNSHLSRLTCFACRRGRKEHPTASQGTTMEPEQIYEPLVFHWTLPRNSAANISSPNLQIPPLLPLLLSE